MRDLEFSKTFERLMPKLDQYFRKRLKGSQYRGDKAVMIDDLIQLTALMALKNSRKSQCDKYTLEELIFIKADNVCNDLFKVKRHRVTELEEVESTAISNNHFETFEARMQLGRLQQAMPEKPWQVFNLLAEGFSYVEIAEQMGTTETSLRMLISRQRTKIASKFL